MEKVSESLAGRVGIIKLLTLSAEEIVYSSDENSSGLIKSYIVLIEHS